MDRSPLQLQTDREDVILREISTFQDDQAYFQAIEASRRPPRRIGDETVVKYQSLEEVTKARTEAGDKIRMGIWDRDSFVGTVNIRPDNRGGAEMGYWVDARHGGRGYATLGARALSRYAIQHFSPVYAQVVMGNELSVRVLEKAGFHRVAKHAGHLIFILLDMQALQANS